MMTWLKNYFHLFLTLVMAMIYFSSKVRHA